MDSYGNILVAGGEVTTGEGDNIWVQKYDPSGSDVWTRTYNGAAGADDGGLGVAVDTLGNVVVSGFETSASGDRDAWVGKYNPDGNALWSRTHDGPVSGHDEGAAVAIDPDGNIIVVGHESVGPTDWDWDLWVRKYDPEGNVLWTRIHNGPGDYYDAGGGVAADTSGDILVGGGAFNGEVNGLEIWLRRYDPNGGVLWTTVEEGLSKWGLWHSISSVAIDMDGDVVVAGTLDRSDWDLDSDIWAAKYDAGGSRLWSQSYGRFAQGWDTGQGVATDSDGRVLVVGSVGQSSNPEWITDIWARKYVVP